MFYIGFKNEETAAIGVAISLNGITDWLRLPDNPIISPSSVINDWDSHAVYKPFPIYSNGIWKIWEFNKFF